jgi:hypothetical protein
VYKFCTLAVAKSKKSKAFFSGLTGGPGRVTPVFLEDAMNNKLDLIFKTAAIILLAVFVWGYLEGRNVGRYAYFRDGELEFVLDTTTGVVYQDGYAMNHLTGKQGTVPGQAGPAKK